MFISCKWKAIHADFDITYYENCSVRNVQFIVTIQSVRTIIWRDKSIILCWVGIVTIRIWYKSFVLSISIPDTQLMWTFCFETPFIVFHFHIMVNQNGYMKSRIPEIQGHPPPLPFPGPDKFLKYTDNLGTKKCGLIGLFFLC